jgi:hypothetical protein
MKNNSILIFKPLVWLALAVFLFSSCDKFLDEMPDNRAEVDSDTKIEKLLVSAYPDRAFIMITEMSSDNVDDYGENNPNTDRFVDEVYHWQDGTEDDNESAEAVWAASYSAIAAANQALQAIEGLENPEDVAMQEAKGEALLCRAYNHFVLVNFFCMHYNEATSSTDLGIPYMEEVESTLQPHYERGNVAEVYQKIERDLEEGLKLVGESYYEQPKYHFNKKAANAFAARFYLYYGKWEKARDYATAVLGSQPKLMLRDWAYQATMTQEYEAIVNHYIASTLNCNLMLCTGMSAVGMAFGPYMYYTRYSHGAYLANNETGNAQNIWGSEGYYSPMKVYGATNLDRTIFWKLPFLFEETDPVAQIGYYRTVYPAFTGDETILIRAEANVMLNNYDAACEDLTTWLQNINKTSYVLTPAKVQAFYQPIAYSYDDDTKMNSTIKKHLNPAFTIDAEGSMQECMLQCVLGFRRIETLQTGLRWFDVKRYGIEIVRRVMDDKGQPVTLVDVLKKNDPRQAIQIPQKVLSAGIAANPR